MDERASSGYVCDRHHLRKYNYKSMSIRIIQFDRHYRHQTTHISTHMSSIICSYQLNTANINTKNTSQSKPLVFDSLEYDCASSSDLTDAYIYSQMCELLFAVKPPTTIYPYRYSKSLRQQIGIKSNRMYTYTLLPVLKPFSSTS